jgi:hypothetical protein
MRCNSLSSVSNFFRLLFSKIISRQPTTARIVLYSLDNRFYTNAIHDTYTPAACGKNYKT